MSESEWVICEFDFQHRVTIPSKVRKFLELGDGYVYVKVKKAVK